MFALKTEVPIHVEVGEKNPKPFKLIEIKKGTEREKREMGKEKEERRGWEERKERWMTYHHKTVQNLIKTGK